MKRNKKNIKTLTLKDGSKYVGDIKNGKITGKGTFTYRDGSKYVGKFKNDKFDVKGILTLPNGKKYLGKFKNGKLVKSLIIVKNKN